MSTTSLANWPKAAGAVNELEPLLARLTAIEPDGHQVISCYLRLEPEDRARSRYLREVRARIRQLEQDPLLLAADDQARDAVRRDLARIVAFLGQPAGLPHAPGLALFACEELELFAAVPLPSVHRTRVVLEDTPWVAELMAVRQEMAPVVVALLDRAHARFFEVTPLAAIELAGLTAPAGRGGRFHSDRADAPGWGEGDYHRRIREERQRRYALVAERLEALVAGRPVRGIVLAGPKDHTAALARHLNRRLARLLLGTCTLNPTAAHTAQDAAAGGGPPGGPGSRAGRVPVRASRVGGCPGPGMGCRRRAGDVAGARSRPGPHPLRPGGSLRARLPLRHHATSGARPRGLPGRGRGSAGTGHRGRGHRGGHAAARRRGDDPQRSGRGATGWLGRHTPVSLSQSVATVVGRAFVILIGWLFQTFICHLDYRSRRTSQLPMRSGVPSAGRAKYEPSIRFFQADPSNQISMTQPASGS